jgi:hypothetical protein
MPRFNISQLLFTTTLVSVGLGMIVFGTDGIRRTGDFAAVPVLSITFGCLAVGLGTAPLLRKPQIGLLIGITLFFCILVYYGKR